MSRTNGGLMVTETNQAYFAKVADCLVQEDILGKRYEDITLSSI
jgi:hypothetical protein